MRSQPAVTRQGADHPVASGSSSAHQYAWVILRLASVALLLLAGAATFLGMGVLWAAAGIQPGSVSDMEGESSVWMLAGAGSLAVAAAALYGAWRAWKARPRS